jgi:hypothetical protein
MARADSGDDAVPGGLGAAQARAERRHEHRRYELQAATVQAYHALREAGLSESRIAQLAGQKGVPFTRSVVAKLVADGDELGWRPPSLRTCQVLDAICRDRGIGSDLAGRREALDEAARALRAAGAADRAADTSRNLAYAQRAALEGELRDYLTALGSVLARTAAWLPYRRLDSGFAERLVKVTDKAPDPGPDGGLYREPPLGTVRWERAIEGVPVAVVLADAGYGKTWQLRRHCLRLCEQALAALDADVPMAEVPVPMWAPAIDLGRCWPGSGRPGAAIVTAAAGELRRSGVPVSADLADFLAARVTAGSAHVLIDAYDEVFDDGRRSSVRQALGWLTGDARRDGLRIILASRQAGYDQPFDLRGDPDDEDAVPDGRLYYLHLGVLEEFQVRRLWAEWFGARGMPVPDERLQPAVTPSSPLRRFAGVPLVAAFCAWVAEKEEVSYTRTGLYGQVLKRFLAQAWKSGAPPDGSPASAASVRQDGARRAMLESALTEMAWRMAADCGYWQDSIEVRRCEQLLAGYGPAAPPGRSHTWEPVRQIGILVQAGGEEHALGDGPVLWIHRSVQQYLVARKLTGLGAAPDPHIENAWLQPAWADVLDFAIGLETGQQEGAVTRAVRAIAAGDHDALGWYAAPWWTGSGGCTTPACCHRCAWPGCWRWSRRPAAKTSSGRCGTGREIPAATAATSGRRWPGRVRPGARCSPS